jgi:hypothetical protein
MARPPVFPAEEKVRIVVAAEHDDEGEALTSCSLVVRSMVLR